MPKPIMASMFSPSISKTIPIKGPRKPKLGLYSVRRRRRRRRVSQTTRGQYIKYPSIRNPFIKEKKRKERDTLKGLLEEVRPLYKEVALKT